MRTVFFTGSLLSARAAGDRFFLTIHGERIQHKGTRGQDTDIDPASGRNYLQTLAVAVLTPTAAAPVLLFDEYLIYIVCSHLRDAD